MAADPSLDQARAALARGDARGAREALGDAQSIPSAFLLAQACRLDGDDAGERAALDRLLALEPRHLGGLLLSGDAHDRAGNGDGAAAAYRSALAAAPPPAQLPTSLTAALDRAAQWLRGDAGTALERVEAALPGPRSPLIDETLAILRGDVPIQLQRPTNLYVPGLPQRAFYDRAEFAWADAIEAETTAIRAELEADLAASADFSPYIAADADRSAGQAPNAHLAGDPSWSALHLLRDGVPVGDTAARFPRTLAALDAIPDVPRIPGRAPMALFSLLRGEAHIRPHHGLFNFRLICHLPLIVPDGCALRVGNHERSWCEGELLIFDDSMEHEARNASSEARYILLFECWKPEIEAADRAALSRLLEASRPARED